MSHRRSPSALVAGLPGQDDRERRSAALDGGLEDEVAVHGPAQLAGDVQAQTAATVGRGFATASEPHEESVAVAVSDAGTAVGDGQMDLARVGLRPNGRADRG